MTVMSHPEIEDSLTLDDELSRQPWEHDTSIGVLEVNHDLLDWHGDLDHEAMVQYIQAPRPSVLRILLSLDQTSTFRLSLPYQSKFPSKEN